MIYECAEEIKNIRIMGIIHANDLKYAQFCSIRFYLSVTKTKITGIPNPTKGQVIGTGTFSGGAGL